MTLSEEDIDRRIPVWEAIADLFLDTDYLGIVGPEKIAARIEPAGFDLATLDHIFAKEVAPALAFNMFDIAGEWAGWDPLWLRMRVANFATSKRLRHRLARHLFARVNRESWLKVREALAARA